MCNYVYIKYSLGSIQPQKLAEEKFNIIYAIHAP